MGGRHVSSMTNSSNKLQPISNHCWTHCQDCHYSDISRVHVQGLPTLFLLFIRPASLASAVCPSCLCFPLSAVHPFPAVCPSCLCYPPSAVHPSSKPFVPPASAVRTDCLSAQVAQAASETSDLQHDLELALQRTSELEADAIVDGSMLASQRLELDDSISAHSTAAAALAALTVVAAKHEEELVLLRQETEQQRVAAEQAQQSIAAQTLVVSQQVCTVAPGVSLMAVLASMCCLCVLSVALLLGCPSTATDVRTSCMVLAVSLRSP